jgi:histidinol-phosphate aminotransferase
MKKLVRRGRRLAALLTMRSRRALDIAGKSTPSATAPKQTTFGPAGQGIAGKVVVITGSTRGVGLTVAEGFAALGAKIVINGRTQAAVEHGVSEIKRRGGDAAGCAVDVGTPEGGNQLIRAALDAFGSIDILINNAGVAGTVSRKAWESSADEWRETLRTNIDGPYYCTSAALRWMSEANRPGRIINVSSGAGDVSVANMCAYGVSKLALQGMTRFLAADLDANGISIVALQLGSLQTDMTRSAFSWEQAELLPSPETVLPAFLHAATAPDDLVHGRTLASWRILADPFAELALASPVSTAPVVSFPELQRKGISVERHAAEAAIFDRGESKFGVSPKAAQAIADNLQPRYLADYPDAQHERLRAALADRLSLPAECFFIGSGSSELIHRMIEFFVKPSENVVSNKPGWFGFNMMCRKLGITTVQIPFVIAGPSNRSHHNLEAVTRAINPATRLVYLISPSNPEGVGLKRDEFLAFLQSIPPHLPVIVDEAYIEFSDDPEIVRANELVLGLDRTLIGLRTFSKFHGLAALRVGYGFAKPEIAALINRMGQVFNVSALSETAAVAALSDLEFQGQVRDEVRQGRNSMEEELRRIGLDYVPSQAPFMLVECPCDVDKLCRQFSNESVFLSPKTYFSGKYMMFPVSTRQHNAKNLEILRSLT